MRLDYTKAAPGWREGIRQCLRLHHAVPWAGRTITCTIIRGRRYGESREGALQFSTAATALKLSAFALREHEATGTSS